MSAEGSGAPLTWALQKILIAQPKGHCVCGACSNQSAQLGHGASEGSRVAAVSQALSVPWQEGEGEQVGCVKTSCKSGVSALGLVVRESDK